MGEIKEHDIHFEVFEDDLNVGLGFVHGLHEEMGGGEGDIGGGLGAGREAGDGGYGDGNKGNEVWVKVERCKLGLGVLGD